MMIDPKTFIEYECKDKTYEELLKVRDELLASVREFEEGRTPRERKLMMPSPDTVYQMDLEYLAELFALIAETYRRETAWGGEADDE